MKKNKFNIFDTIISPVITEKSTKLSEMNKVVFKVNRNLNKKQIKSKIEKIFKINVVKVNVINRKSKIKISRGNKIKKTGYKKAIITIKKGQNIDLTSGI